MFSTDANTISSDFEISNADTETFDKKELILWASKLELESIDSRKSNLELISNLTEVANSLKNSLNAVREHLSDMKNDNGEREKKLRTFIEFTISEEFDRIYGKINKVLNRIEFLESRSYLIDDSKTFQSKVEKFIKLSNDKAKRMDDQLLDLEAKYESLISRDVKTSFITPQSSLEMNDLFSQQEQSGNSQSGINSRGPNKMFKIFEDKGLSSEANSHKDIRFSKTISSKSYSNSRKKLCCNLNDFKKKFPKRCTVSSGSMIDPFRDQPSLQKTRSKTLLLPVSKKGEENKRLLQTNKFSSQISNPNPEENSKKEIIADPKKSSRLYRKPNNEHKENKIAGFSSFQEMSPIKKQTSIIKRYNQPTTNMRPRKLIFD